MYSQQACQHTAVCTHSRPANTQLYYITHQRFDIRKIPTANLLNFIPNAPKFPHKIRYKSYFRNFHVSTRKKYGPGSSVGIATDYGLDGSGSNPGGDEIFRTRPDRPWGPLSLLYNGYRVFPGDKVRPGRAADHSPPSSVAVMEE